MESTRMVNGTTYVIEEKVKPVSKISTLKQDTVYTVKSVDPEPTRYGSFVVTVANELETFQVFMPEYIVEQARPDKMFFYNGLVKKDGSSGHSYHSVDWIKKKLI